TMHLLTFDYDNITITKASSYRVHSNDTLGVISLGNSTFRYIKRIGTPSWGTVIQTVVTVLTQNVSTPYIVDVVLEDVTYEPATTTTTVYSKQAIHRIIFMEQPVEVKKYTYTGSIDNASAKYSL
ncbi:unnamed protein product, partial [Candidula unifasciata]